MEFPFGVGKCANCAQYYPEGVNLVPKCKERAEHTPAARVKRSEAIGLPRDRLMYQHDRIVYEHDCIIVRGNKTRFGAWLFLYYLGIRLDERWEVGQKDVAETAATRGVPPLYSMELQPAIPHVGHRSAGRGEEM